ncbi:MAG: DUF1846 family protein, partial [Coriobacteriia bacterium]|nr:DUF1846 family protein [Coriobacteriia bacterium]
AYEAATVDLDDANIIDPFHLEAHNEITVNYNRDVEIFPVLKAMMEKILGESPYKSPTDMGVNMAGNAICDDEVCRRAANNEILRRYFNTAVKVKRTGSGEDEVARLELIMQQSGLDYHTYPGRKEALIKAEATGLPAGAIILEDGRVITGKTSALLGAASSTLMNALKAVAGIDDEALLISDEALEPICNMKIDYLHSQNPRLHPNETIIALSISSATDKAAATALEALKKLQGCDAFFSVIIPEADERLYRTLGINVCCEPQFENHHYYHK